MKDSRATQHGRILEVLIAARGDWVPLPKVQACAAQYNARLYELRRLGFRITSKIQDENGQRRFFFRLVFWPAAAGAQERQPVTVANHNPFPEFGNLAPERYGD